MSSLETCECSARVVAKALDQHGTEQRALIPILQQVQADLGYLPVKALKDIAAGLHLPQSEVLGVATFYSQFRLLPIGKHVVKVCQGTACHVKGASRILDEVERMLEITPGETTKDGQFSLERIACFGACSMAPVMVIDEDVYGGLSSDMAKGIIKERA